MLSWQNHNPIIGKKMLSLVIGLAVTAVAAAFADYMDHIGATATMVRICVKSLKLVRAPYVILAPGYVLGQCLHIAEPPQTLCIRRARMIPIRAPDPIRSRDANTLMHEKPAPDGWHRSGQVMGLWRSQSP
jgi:hypothetical protein